MSETATRRCVRCWEIFPLDYEHFGRRMGAGGARRRGEADSFSHHCRACGNQTTAPRRGSEWVLLEDGKGVWT